MSVYWKVEPQLDQHVFSKTFYLFLARPGANFIKLITSVIYCRSTVIPSFCVIKWYYCGNYCGMLVSNIMVIYHGILTLEEVSTVVNALTRKNWQKFNDHSRDHYKKIIRSS